MADATPALDIRGLSKSYRTGHLRAQHRLALHDLTLEVPRGSVFGCLGPNGSGKSTTLKLLLGLIFPDAGTATILGHPIGARAARAQLGYLPENPYFYDYLTAEELLNYYAQLSGLEGAHRARRVAAVLDEVGIGAERRMRLRSYSKGMIQRVGVAQAIVAEPSIVFFDEPMSGLDPLGRRDLRQLLLGLRDRGCTIFFSSHILADAEALCSRVGIIAQGRLVADGRLADLVAFELRGWELVVMGLTEDLRGRLAARLVSMTQLSDDRWSLELGAVAPEPLLQELAHEGAHLVSLNPIRTSLEDYFVKTVGAAAPRDTSGLA